MKSGPLPIEQVVDIGLQLARALAVAHTAGVVHRDIKPENVIKTPSGVVKVLDFGLARVEGATNRSLTGVLLGTPAYMSPEQARGQHADFRTDLFALGLVLYELASAVNPFAAATVTATIARIVEEDPAPLSQVQPSAVPEFERIVTTCLKKDPLSRYQSTQELVVELEELAADLAERRRTSSHRSHPAYSAERFRPQVVVAGASARGVGRLRADAVSRLARAGLAATPLGHAVRPHGAGVGLRSHEPAAARMVHRAVLPERGARSAGVDPRRGPGGAMWCSRRS